MTSYFVLSFSVLVGRRSHHASLTKAERDLKMEKIRSSNHAWKDKSLGSVEASSGIAPGPHKGGLQRPIRTPVAMANMLTHIGLWPTAIKLNP